MHNILTSCHKLVFNNCFKKCDTKKKIYRIDFQPWRYFLLKSGMEHRSTTVIQLFLPSIKNNLLNERCKLTSPFSKLELTIEAKNSILFQNIPEIPYKYHLALKIPWNNANSCFLARLLNNPFLCFLEPPLQMPKCLLSPPHLTLYDSQRVHSPTTETPRLANALHLVFPFWNRRTFYEEEAKKKDFFYSISFQIYKRVGDRWLWTHTRPIYIFGHTPGRKPVPSCPLRDGFRFRKSLEKKPLTLMLLPN